jgi:hypothetical protein
MAEVDHATRLIGGDQPNRQRRGDRAAAEAEEEKVEEVDDLTAYPAALISAGTSIQPPDAATNPPPSVGMWNSACCGAHNDGRPGIC